MTIASTAGILGGLLVRSVSLAAGVALAILLVASLFSAPIPIPVTAAAESAYGEPVAHVARDTHIIIR